MSPSSDICAPRRPRVRVSIAGAAALLALTLGALPNAGAPGIARAASSRALDLESQWDLRLTGADDRDEFGVSLASGDWNGDGIDDLAVGAWLGDSYTNDRKNAGEVYVFFGKKISHRTGGEGLRNVDVIYGSRRNERSGTAVCSGDWDGDGTPDVAIGARFSGPPSDTLAPQGGRVTIVYGAAPAESALEILDIGAHADLILLGEDEGDRFGQALLFADLDSDGFDDLLVAAVEADGAKNRRRESGGVYCIWGQRADDRPTSLDMVDFDDWRIDGVDPNDGLGRSMAASDLDGDGKLDLVLCASFADGAENAETNAGEAYVLFGGTREELAQKTDLARNADCALYGSGAYENVGVGLATGDFDGDGLADIALGADLADSEHDELDRCGAVYMMRGRPRAEWKRRYELRRDADAILSGSIDGEQAGRNLVALRWNADAYMDLAIASIIASPASPPRDRAGKVFIVLGSADIYGAPSESRVLSRIADRVIEGAGSKDQAGYCLSAYSGASGSVDRLLIGAPFADGPRDERTDAGELYVISPPAERREPPAP